MKDREQQVRKQKIIEAKKVIREMQADVRKPHSRIHIDALDINLHRQRALEGLCGSCEFLKIEFDIKDGRKRVALRCGKGNSPIELYQNTELGKQRDVECKDYLSIHNDETNTS